VLHRLTQQDIEFFRTQGYVVLHNAVPPEELQAVVEAMWAFLRMDPADPQDWYRAPLNDQGVVELYHHQALWDVRQNPQVYHAFADLWGRKDLWVQIQRCGLLPPVIPGDPYWDNLDPIHWDIDSGKLPFPFCVQGMLYLTDTDEDQGCLQVISGMHREVMNWVETQPPDRDLKYPDPTGLEVRKIPGKAGDLIIWHRGLPHGASQNTSNKPRLTQYLFMAPALSNEAQRQQRINQWQHRLPPDGAIGDPRHLEQKYGQTAKLTKLGRRILGLENYPKPINERLSKNIKRLRHQFGKVLHAFR
jgi:hypothetical protein